MSEVSKKTKGLRVKDGRFYFQRRVPDALRATLGLSEFWEALGEVTPRQADTLATRRYSETTDLFHRLRHEAGLSNTEPIPAPRTAREATLLEVQALAAMAGRSMLQADDEVRISGALPVPEAGPGMGLDAALRDAVSGRDVHAVAMQANDWLRGYGLELPQAPEDSRRALYTWAQFMAKARQGQKLRDEGEPIDTPPAPVLPASIAADAQKNLAPADKSLDALKLRDVVELWKGHQKRPAKTLQVAEQALLAFEKLTGNPTLGTLVKADGMKFRSALLLEPGMSEHTAAKLLGWVQIFLNFEAKEVGRLAVNPWKGTAIAPDLPQVREEWTDEDAVRLFSTPLHQAYQLPKGSNSGADAAYWLPILGAFTGARVTELAQLLCADLTEEQGVWLINFRVTYPAWQSLKAKKTAKKVPASKRSIPMHPELIRLGLLDYCRAIKQVGHERLFPAARWSELNHAGGSVANWFSKFKTGLKFGPSNTFHGWRNSVETRLQRARETQIIIDKYLGHTPEGSEGVRYARLTAQDLIGVPEKIGYTGLVLPVAWPPKGWSPPATVSIPGKP